MTPPSPSIDILLVEDNSNDVELTLRALRKNNLAGKVFVVRDGTQALEFLFAEGAFAERKNQSLPKVVFLDLKLPKINGLEVLQRVRAEPRTRHLPVVMLTSSQQDRDIAECYKLCVNSYIVKPVDFEQFVQTIGDCGLYWLLLNQAPITPT